MNIRQIESFILLSNELHYGKTAERLGISQPSLSQQMKALEHSLGVSLFVKHGRNIQLTKAGKVFLQRAMNIQSEVENAEEEMKYFQSSQRENIRLGLSGSHLIIDAFHQFTNAYPDISLYINEYSTKQTIDKVIDHQLDVGIIYSHDKSKELIREPLFVDELFAVVPKSHEYATRKALSLKDLDNQAVILLGKDLFIRKFIDKELTERNIVPNIICELSNFYACLAYTEEQLGISVISRSLLKNTHLPSSVAVKSIEDLSFRYSIDLIYNQTLVLDEPLDYLLTTIRKMKDSFKNDIM
jgi:DNA-binding transcriptional LysR family regulator